MADIFLTDVFLRDNGIHALEVTVLNEKHACVLGLSNSSDIQLSKNLLFRTNLECSSSLSIRRPAFILPVKELSVQLISSVDPFLLTLLDASLLFRLQRAHILLGTVEYFKLLGTRSSVRFINAVDLSGRVYDFGENISAECQSVPFNAIPCESLKPEDNSAGCSYIFSDQVERVPHQGSCVFLPTPSVHGVFKVGPSTKLRIEFHDPVSSNGFAPICDKVQSAEPIQLESKLLGLDSVEAAVRDYILQFAISSTCSKNIVHDCKGGILLYGLAGCGKSKLLSKISQSFSRWENDPLNLGWCNHLQFVTLTSTVARSLGRGRPTVTNPFRQWLLEQRARARGGHPQSMVIYLPDLDTWVGGLTSESDDGDQTYEDDTGGHRASSAGATLFYQFYSAIEDTERVADDELFNICVIATATTSDGILQSQEGRQLFFRRILVPLPDAHTRHNILRQEILIRLHNSAACQEVNGVPLPDADSFFKLEEGAESLLRLASKLHGYTPRDLHRLVQISWASFLSASFVRPSEEASLKRTPALSDLCEVLARESRNYMQINLSQFTTPVSPLRWDDIGGYEYLKTLLRTVVQNRLASAARLDSEEALADAALGLRVPRGILLHGPPGCSKTMFVRALATECQLPLIAVQASRIFGRYVGDSERNMRRILVQARASAPAILFIDEIDLLLPSRSSSETGASEHVLSEVLLAMDGVEGQIGQVILIAATNRMDKLDSALSRAGRFDLVIDVPPPDSTARAAILHLELSRRAVDDTLLSQTDWLNNFAHDRLKGYTGAEVVQVIQLAAQLARNSGHNRISRSCLVQAQKDCPPVSLDRYSSSMRPTFSLTTHLHHTLMLLPKSLLFGSLLLFLLIGLALYAWFPSSV